MLYKLIRTNSENIHFQQLVKLLDADLAIRDGDDHAFYAQFNKTDTIKYVVVAYHEEQAVACGAIRQYDDRRMEVKRMFVLPEFRGKGLAQSVLNEVEKWAGELGFEICILETGKMQPEAIRLYHKCGYKVIANYGQYENVENSVCMEKQVKV